MQASALPGLWYVPICPASNNSVSYAGGVCAEMKGEDCSAGIKDEIVWWVEISKCFLLGSLLEQNQKGISELSIHNRDEECIFLYKWKKPTQPNKNTDSSVHPS